jgi:ankyrin repeat protein
MALKAYKKEMSQIVNMLKEEHIKIHIIKKLLKEYYKKNFNFNSKYYQGKTLLHYVIENDACNLISILIKYGCNPNLCDDSYMTPLHISVTKGNIKAIKKLIKNGADVNMVGEFEQTPLHLAVICGNLKMAKVLIKNGADILLVDEKNLSVLDYAKDEKNNIIIDYLSKKINFKKGE